MIAGAQIPIAPIDQPDAHVGLIVLGHRFHETAELPRDAVDLAADGASDGGLLRGLGRRNALGEQAKHVAIARAVVGGAAAASETVKEIATEAEAGGAELEKEAAEEVEAEVEEENNGEGE